MLFAISALIFVGLTWTLAGIVVGSAAKHGLKTGFIQFCGAIISVLISLGVLCFMPRTGTSPQVFCVVMGVLVAAGAINFTMLEFMAAAMQRGQNGLIWSLIQSALVIPFVVGVIFFGSELNSVRGTGVFLIVLSIIILGTQKKNGPQEKGKWRLLTFIAFILAGLTITLINSPSYFRQADTVTSVQRALAVALGTFLASTIRNLYTAGKKNILKEFSEHIRNKRFIFYILTFQGFGIISGYFLIYPAMNALAKAGTGAIAYPLMISSCIIGFNLYSMFMLREKWTFLQVLATFGCIIGAAMTCF